MIENEREDVFSLLFFFFYILHLLVAWRLHTRITRYVNDFSFDFYLFPFPLSSTLLAINLIRKLKERGTMKKKSHRIDDKLNENGMAESMIQTKRMRKWNEKQRRKDKFFGTLSGSCAVDESPRMKQQKWQLWCCTRNNSNFHCTFSSFFSNGFPLVSMFLLLNELEHWFRFNLSIFHPLLSWFVCVYVHACESESRKLRLSPEYSYVCLLHSMTDYFDWHHFACGSWNETKNYSRSLLFWSCPHF